MPQEKSGQDDQRVFLQAALLWHTQKLYETAHDACCRTGAYENGDGFKLDVLAVIDDAVQKLAQLQKCRSESPRCLTNKDCAPPQICVDGACVNPFTGEVMRPAQP